MWMEVRTRTHRSGAEGGIRLITKVQEGFAKRPRSRVQRASGAGW